jgi:hypothetical protein
MGFMEEMVDRVYVRKGPKLVHGVPCKLEMVIDALNCIARRH